MEIEQLTSLIKLLAALDFPSSTGRTLLFYACLRQKQFVVREQMSFGEDTMYYQLYFKEDTNSKKLTCLYYDATLKKAVEISTAIINGIGLPDLERRMHSVNWQIPLEHSPEEELQLADKNTWKQEAAIEEVTRELEVLGSTKEGADIANMLRYKFWSDPILQGSISELQALKSKYELNQRFYIIKGDGITALEAYRFLNNRWMERQIHITNRLLRQSESGQKDVKAVIKNTIDKKKQRHSRENAGK